MARGDCVAFDHSPGEGERTRRSARARGPVPPFACVGVNLRVDPIADEHAAWFVDRAPDGDGRTRRSAPTWGRAIKDEPLKGTETCATPAETGSGRTRSPLSVAQFQRVGVNLRVDPISDEHAAWFFDRAPDGDGRTRGSASTGSANGRTRRSAPACGADGRARRYISSGKPMIRVARARAL